MPRGPRKAAQQPKRHLKAKQAEQEAASARKEGASASAADKTEEQEGRECAAGDTPPSKRRRGPAGARKAAPAKSGARRTPATAPDTAGAHGAGAWRAGAGPPPRSAAAPPKPDKKRELLGVSKVDTWRWAATIHVKDTGEVLDLGTFGMEVAAAEAYDIAALTLNGLFAPTNYHPDLYCDGPLLDILEELPESKLVAEIRNQILTRHPSAKPAAPT